MFRNRKEAGQLLAGRLAERGYLRPVVLALSRGGVPVAFQVAAALGAPLDVLVAGIGSPFRERAAGSESRGVTLDRRAFAAEREELERRYRNGLPLVEIAGRSAILVDDAIPTSDPMRAAASALRGMAPRRIIVAAPVVARLSIQELAREVDAVVCLLRPARLRDARSFYEEFGEVTDLDVGAWLSRASGARPA